MKGFCDSSFATAHEETFFRKLLILVGSPPPPPPPFHADSFKYVILFLRGFYWFCQRRLKSMVQGGQHGARK